MARLSTTEVCHTNKLPYFHNSQFFVVVTSAIHLNGSSYEYAKRAGFNTRSYASAAMRLNQTLTRTIPSLRDKFRQYAKDTHIVLLEQGSYLSPNERELLSKAADTLIVLRDFDPNAQKFVDGPFKGLGEAYALLQFAVALEQQGVMYQQWFKISGRYWLQDEFQSDKIQNKRQFVFGKATDGNPTTTFFYSVPRSLNYRFIAQMIRIVAGNNDPTLKLWKGGTLGASGKEPIMERMIDLNVAHQLIDRRVTVYAEGTDGVTGGQKLG